MTIATTASYSQHVLEISEDNSTWARICGLKNFTATFQAQTGRDEIPDCTDESLPNYVQKFVNAVDLVVSGTGKWAQESHETLLQWMLTGALKYARVGYLNAAIGDVEYVSGQAILTQLVDERDKNMAVNRNIQVEWSGALTTTDQTT